MRHIAFAAFPAVLVCALTACSDRPSLTDPVDVAQPIATAAAQSRPSDADASFPIENCGFTIDVELSGKVKPIEFPDGRSISTAPGLTATLTNPANGKQETFVITGALHKSVSENGDTVSVATGRNILLDPFVPGLVGVFLTIGAVNWVVDQEGHLVQPLEGPGKLIDVCAILA
jgi:hypothetical protein